MKPAPFEYALAESVEHAIELLSVGDAKVLAGGQSLLPVLNFRLARPSRLVDVGRLSELDFLRVDEYGVTIGALCRHVRIESAAELDGPWTCLREAARQVGHHPIRTRGTFGGSLAHADPAAEFPVVCTALEAEILVEGPAGRRTIPVAELFTGPLQTALAEDELLLEVRLPAPPLGATTAFEELSPRAGDFALASACVGLAVEDGRCTWARVALGSVGPTPLRAPDAEAALVGSDLGAEALAAAGRAAAVTADPSSDIHATQEFRRELADVLTRRAATRARWQ